MKKAVIMAGGFGTRLRPLTMNIPKPMVPMANLPMMHHIVNLLKKHSITEIASLLYFQPEKITSYFGNGEKFGISMNYVQAQADYGTAGSVRNAAHLLGERFLVISGDVLTDFDISAALHFHESRGAKATIILTKAPNPLQFGIVMTDADGKITRFLEKPTWGEVFSDTINTGIYIVEPEVLDMIPYQQDFDFSKDLFPLMLRKGIPLYGYVADGYWQDVGNLDQYIQAHHDILAGKVALDFDGRREGSAIISHTAKVAATAKLKGTVIVGDNATIGEYAELENVVVGAASSIGNGAKIANSVIWQRVAVGECAEMDADVVCNDVRIGDFAEIEENVFISNHCSIGTHAHLMSNIKLWPYKVVEERARLAQSLVHEDKWMRELFTDAKVTGTSNVEMTPEFGAKFGSALGNALGKGTRVISSRDQFDASRMVKRAMIAGLMSSGVSVVDMQVTPLPLTRQALIGSSAMAGIHVRQSPYHPTQTDIILLNAEGRDLPSSATKKIERLFFGEDIERVRPEHLGSISYPERGKETYFSRYEAALQLDVIQKAGFNLAIDYSFGMSSTVFPRILGALNVNAVALNAWVDSSRAYRSNEERAEDARRMSSIMRSLHYNIGFIIDPGAEKLSVVDSDGSMVDPTRLLTLVTALFLRTYKSDTPYSIAVPVTATSEIETIASDYQVQVIRIKDSHSAMMEATKNADIRFVGSTRGGFIFTDFFFAADAMYSIGKILEMMATLGTSVRDLDQRLPRRSVAERTVACPWERKGTIMRKAMESSEGNRRELVDGVRIFLDDEIVLLIPDRERANFHVMAEARTQEKADKLADQYKAYVEKWRDTE